MGNKATMVYVTLKSWPMDDEPRVFATAALASRDCTVNDRKYGSAQVLNAITCPRCGAEAAK